jgi:hypothetical protein
MCLSSPTFLENEKGRLGSGNLKEGKTRPSPENLERWNIYSKE